MRERLEKQGRGRPFLTGLASWALALGCVIGWGSFVMPGSTFLPEAGPLGTVIGIVIAASFTLVIGANYSYLARHFEGGTGSYYYTKELLGYDHAFLAAWSIALAYLSLLWANSTAFILIGRYLFGDVLETGFKYTIAGYDVYATEVLVTILIQILYGVLACYASKAAASIRTALAMLLFVSVVILFIGVVVHVGPRALFNPPFASGTGKPLQVLNIAILAPWLFVGFETVCHMQRRGGSWTRSVFRAAMFAIVAGMMVYILLMLIGGAGVPEGYGNWQEYVADLGQLDGVAAMPVLFNVRHALGGGGLALVSVAIFCALSTSVLGFYHAASSVICIMAEDGLLPRPLAFRKNGTPQGAILAIMILSLPIPFLGRTAVGWNADVSTLSVAIVYAYISLCTVRKARKNGEKGASFMGILGTMVAVFVFFMLLVPNIFSQNALATESYLLLAAWSFVGILYYWVVLRRDQENRFGHATAMWLMMLFLLFFSANVWLRLDTQDILEKGGPDVIASALMRQSLIMMALLVVALLIMFSLFKIMLQRETHLHLRIMQSEERNQAKTSFLSNMSHDIRTPMNSIVGFTNLAIQSFGDMEKVRDYLGKIQAASNHLLSLINDVLEMSRIESGKIELEESLVSLPEVLHNLNAIVIAQIDEKKQTLMMDAVGVRNEEVYCDKLRLNQVLLNLLSNAIKYTPPGGMISLRLIQEQEERDGRGFFEFRVKDNGIGMTPEFAEKVFEAFEREKNSMVDGIQGTGLGMAITKRFVDLMGGTIEVNTAVGVGTEFIVRIAFRLPDEQDRLLKNTELAGLRALVVDDDLSVCDSTVHMLADMGMKAEYTLSGREAVERAAQAKESGEEFDVFVIDWRIPDLSGKEVARQIREVVGKKPPIVVITAYDRSAIRDDALEVGVSGFCSKPVFFSELRSALYHLLGEEDALLSEQEEVPVVSYAGRRLLVVDDIEFNREIARDLLEISDFEIEEACNGSEAVEKVASSEPGYYDAVLMDVQMPIMNGYEAARAIRQLEDPILSSIPIIAMTANAFDEDRRAALEAGMNGHVPKPFDVDEVIGKLAALFAEREAKGTND